MTKSITIIVLTLMMIFSGAEADAKGAKRGSGATTVITWVGDIPSPASLFNNFCTPDRKKYLTLADALFKKGYTELQRGGFLLADRIEISGYRLPKADEYCVRIVIADKELYEKYFKDTVKLLESKSNRIGYRYSIDGNSMEYMVRLNVKSAKPKRSPNGKRK